MRNQGESTLISKSETLVGRILRHYEETGLLLPISGGYPTTISRMLVKNLAAIHFDLVQKQKLESVINLVRCILNDIAGLQIQGVTRFQMRADRLAEWSVVFRWEPHGVGSKDAVEFRCDAFIRWAMTKDIYPVTGGDLDKLDAGLNPIVVKEYLEQFGFTATKKMSFPCTRCGKPNQEGYIELLRGLPAIQQGKSGDSSIELVISLGHLNLCPGPHSTSK